ncbi:MTH895/ArsE family thioredoxin-like protein [Thiomicrorhabdus indica]|uniref:MTH895/ArsE family thioredoxin-like protein n=1 Tax=Thiomicrorhabdus indica TaxID=2267253 RepID=UPI002AA5F0AD|nr:MTH895/ArsE family thioredoxin-like protein [Thiomicrorhabdus indica]
MKGNLMVRLMTMLILIAIGLAHYSEQTNLMGLNWLWLAIMPALMGLQATFTGWCPAELVGKLSKNGECCPGGSCSSQAKPVKESSCCSETEKNSCCDSQPEEKTTSCCGNALEIKVLGTGCATCVNAVKLIETTAEELGVSVMVTKVEEISDIATYGVMSTPGIVIHDQVVHSGSMPNKKMIAQWLSRDPSQS